MIRPGPAESNSYLDATWFSLAARVSQIAAETVSVSTIVDKVTEALSQIDKAAVSVIIASDDKVERSYYRGCSQSLSNLFVDLVVKGFRFWNPIRGSVEEPSEYPILPALAKEGIRSFCAWPLVTASRRVGVLHIGLTTTSSMTVPPDYFMEVLANVLSLSIEREMLFRSKAEVVHGTKWKTALSEAIINGAADGLCVTDELGTAILVNPEAERILGIVEFEALGRRLGEAQPKIASLVLCGIEASRKESDVVMETSIGDTCTMGKIRISRFLYHETIYLVWSLSDYSDNFMVQPALNERKSKDSPYVVETKISTFSCDSNGNIKTMDSTLPFILGLSQGMELIGSCLYSIAVFKDSGIAEKIEQCIETTRPQITNHNLGDSPGATKITLHLAPVYNEKNQVAGVQAIVENISSIES